jgi:hypothetical protein
VRCGCGGYHEVVHNRPEECPSCGTRDLAILEIKMVPV